MNAEEEESKAIILVNFGHSNSISTTLLVHVTAINYLWCLLCYNDRPAALNYRVIHKVDKNATRPDISFCSYYYYYYGDRLEIGHKIHNWSITISFASSRSNWEGNLESTMNGHNNYSNTFPLLCFVCLLSIERSSHNLQEIFISNSSC